MTQDDLFDQLQDMTPEAAAALLESDQDAQDLFCDGISWLGQDWHDADRSTGAEAGYATVTAYPEWVEDIVQCLPVAMADCWRADAACRMTEARGA